MTERLCKTRETERYEVSFGSCATERNKGREHELITLLEIIRQFLGARCLLVVEPATSTHGDVGSFVKPEDGVEL